MIIPEDYAQVNLRYTGTGVPTGAEVTFGIRPIDPVITPLDAASAVLDAYTSAAIIENITEHVTLSEVYVKFGPNDTGPFTALPASLPGLVTNPCVPPNSGVLVTKQTPFGGRAGRGRFYLPGIQENGVLDGGTIDGTLVSDIQVTMAQFLTNLDTNDVAMVVLHGPGSPITTPTAVNALIVSNTLATQRRRLRR